MRSTSSVAPSNTGGWATPVRYSSRPVTGLRDDRKIICTVGISSRFSTRNFCVSGRKAAIVAATAFMKSRSEPDEPCDVIR
jgi:hypothetical protein